MIIREVFFDIAECLSTKPAHWDVGRLTRVSRLIFFAVLGAVISQEEHQTRGLGLRFVVSGGV